MKPSFLAALAVMFSVPAFTQENEPTSHTVPLRVADAVPDASRIRFIPPPPPEPAPEITSLSSTVCDHGPHRITIARGEPSTLPDIPPPPPRRETPPDISFVAPEVEAITLGLSVTIYDRALSHLKWTDTRTNEHFEAWCAWDWELVSPVSGLTGEKFRCLVFAHPMHVDTRKWKLAGIPYREIPPHPELAPGAFRITAGSADAPLGTALLEAYHSYLHENLPALEAALAARRQASAEAAAWRAAHPPVPQDTTIWLRPHRGSRYLPQDGKETAR